MPRQSIVSPLGEAAWAKILGEAAGGYEEGDPRAWSINLLLDPSQPETIAFIEQLEAEIGNTPAQPRSRLDKTFVLQTLQGLSQRCAADPRLLRQF